MTDLQALFTGMLVGLLLKVKGDMLNIREIEPLFEDGNYRPSFLVRFGSGEKILVTVEHIQ